MVAIGSVCVCVRAWMCRVLGQTEETISGHIACCTSNVDRPRLRAGANVWRKHTHSVCVR